MRSVVSSYTSNLFLGTRVVYIAVTSYGDRRLREAEKSGELKNLLKRNQMKCLLYAAASPNDFSSFHLAVFQKNYALRGAIQSSL